MVASPEVVPSPPVVPLPYGLYSAAVVLDADAHEGLAGFTYEPVSCGQVHLTVAACVEDTSDPGTASISVADTSIATITEAGAPAGEYTVWWGDGTSDTSSDLNADTHDYAAPGDYVVRIEGPDGYRAGGVITVEEAAASGPFDLTPELGKIADDGIDWVESGDPTPHYALVRCAPIGNPDLRARAQAAIDLNEPRAIEEGFIARVASETTVDLTPAGGAVSPEVGFALLQRHAATVYGGIPVIHADRAVAQLVDHMNRRGGRLETEIGAIVAAGAGYADAPGPGESPDPTPAGEAWVYITGQIVVRRGVTEVLDAPIRAVGTGKTNELVVLGERTSAVSYECVTAAVRVEVA